MENRPVFVIFNPHSGNKSASKTRKSLLRYLPLTFPNYRLAETLGPTHATDLSFEALKENYYAILVVGGDGTANEVGAALVKSSTALGLVPTGSSNALARHLGIPISIKKALYALAEARVVQMDVGLANKKVFLNVAGLGYNAALSHRLAERNENRHNSYWNSVLATFLSFRIRSYKLKVNQRKIKRKALMISVANGSQFGHRSYIAPQASLVDGLLNVTLVGRFPSRFVPFFTWQLFSKKIEDSRFTESMETTSLIVKQKTKIAHLDGEAYHLGKKIAFRVVPRALNILAPKEITHV